MSLSPEAHHALYADQTGASLEAQLGAALARNVAGGLAVAETTSLADIAAAAVAEAHDPVADTGHGIVEQFSRLSHETQTTISTSHYASKEVFHSIDREPPSLGEFAAAGINFEKLGSAHETMTRLGLEPEFVFAPVLSLDEWRQTYQTLQDNPRVNRAGHIKNGGLWLHDDVEANWDTLQASDNVVTIDDQDWQVSVMPGTAAPTIVDVDHNGTKDGADVTINVKDLVHSLEVGTGKDLAFEFKAAHPTIASYLTLQATKLHTLESPMDSATYTWLHGEFGDPSSLRAPRGYWNSDGGLVYVHWSSVSRRLGDLGVRLPVWGTA